MRNFNPRSGPSCRGSRNRAGSSDAIYGSKLGGLNSDPEVTLRGTKAGDLPVEMPNKYELVVSVVAARALGLQVPEKLLALADEVIE